MDHIISYYEKVKAFAIREKKEQETRRFVLESNLNRKGYHLDANYYKSEISKCHANEGYLDFIIKFLTEKQTEITKSKNEENCCKQLTF